MKMAILMDWKEFLRPSWQKLALAAVILFLLAQVIILKIDYWSIPILGLHHNWKCDPYPCQTQDTTLYFLLAAIVAYFIACLLAHFWLKAKK